VIVIDASAALSALLNAGPARRALATQPLHAPHLIDPEIASGLRRRVAAGQLSADAAWTRLRVWQRLGLTRYAMFAALHRIWELRDNVSAYDATYIALAEFLDCPLLTAAARLCQAPGTRCAITTVPS
jgi:predicted nucleic acid-binding protein